MSTTFKLNHVAIILAGASLALILAALVYEGIVRTSMYTGGVVGFVGSAIYLLSRYLDTRQTGGGWSQAATLRDLRRLIEQTRRDIDLHLKERDVLDDDRREELVRSIVDRIETEAAEGVLKGLEARMTVRHEARLALEPVETLHRGIHQRLTEELLALTRRGNVNLILGIVTTVSGLILLGFYVTATPWDDTNPTTLMAQFVPRVSLVLFIEIFAFFFLRLYRSSLTEIKYYQNELTSIDSRAIALYVAVHRGQDAETAEVIKTIASTQRNNILEKGQSTVDLEVARLERDTVTSLASDLSSVIGNRRSPT